MKLRLDEVVPVRIGRELRARGFDVDSAAEDPSPRGLSDAHQLARAAADDRALVTYDAGDLLPLGARRTAAGEEQAGLVLLASSRFPQGHPDMIVESLTALLEGPERATGFVHWL